MTGTDLRGGAPVATLVDRLGNQYWLHYSPEGASLTGVGTNHARLPRQGLKPLIRFDNKKNRQLSITHTVTGAYGDPGITAAVRTLMGLADQPTEVRLINLTDDIETAGWWKVTDLAVTVKSRDNRNQIHDADLAWTLLEAFDERPEIGRVPPPPPPPPPPVVAPKPPGSRYTVVKGDSLWRIAERLLGNPLRWREIYDINRASGVITKDPEMFRGLLTVWIYPGNVLQIPAR